MYAFPCFPRLVMEKESRRGSWGRKKRKRGNWGREAGEQSRIESRQERKKQEGRRQRGRARRTGGRRDRVGRR